VQSGAVRDLPAWRRAAFSELILWLGEPGRSHPQRWDGAPPSRPLSRVPAAGRLRDHPPDLRFRGGEVPRQSGDSDP